MMKKNCFKETITEETIMPAEKNFAHDCTGQLIHIGSIVTITGVPGYNGLEGLVVEPCAPTEEGPLGVAVYFDREFTIPWKSETHLIPKHVWDSEHALGCPEILFTSYLWEKCYRVKYFYSHTLEIKKYWSIECLAKRTFPGAQSWITPLPENRADTGIRNDLPCGIKGCWNRPTKLALVYTWGIVRHINTCNACYEHYHGQVLSSLPELKKHEDASIAC